MIHPAASAGATGVGEPLAGKAPVEFWFDFISPFGDFASLRIDASLPATGAAWNGARRWWA